MPDAWIDHSERTAGEQFVRQLLRGHIGSGRETAGGPLIAAYLVEISAEVCEIIIVGDLLFEPVHLDELAPFVERDLCPTSRSRKPRTTRLDRVLLRLIELAVRHSAEKA